MPDDDDSTEDEDLNSGWRGKQKASQSTSGDGKAGANRDADAQEAAAQERETLAASVAAGTEPPTVNVGYDVLQEINGVLFVNGQPAVSDYIPTDAALTMGDPDAPLNTAQAASSTNAVEAGLVEAAPAELHRAEQNSRSVEQLEIETAETNGDKKRAKEARKRRNTYIGIATGLTGAVAILVPTLLKVFGVISDSGTGGSTAGGGGTKGDPKAPAVKDYDLQGLNPNKPVTVALPSVILQAADPTVDPASVALTSKDSDDDNRLTVFQAGQFRLDPAKGDLTFTPVAYFRGGKAEAGVTIANKSKQRSARAKVTLEFDVPPLVLDQFIQADLTQTNVVTFNPVTGKGVDMGGAAVKGTHDLDPTRVFFRAPMPLEGGPPQQGTITVTGGRDAVADGEGKWSISATDGTITFTRDPAFTGDPTPMTYTMLDKAGIESNVGKLIVTSFLSQVLAAVNALNAMDDTSFWSAYKSRVIGGAWGALDDAAEIVGKLTLFRTVHLVIAQTTRQSLSGKDNQAVQDAVPNAATMRASYTTWAASGFDLNTLYTEAEKLSPATTPVAAITNGTRMLRLVIISRLLGIWQDAIDAAAGGGT